MRKRISVRELSLGMYVHGVDIPWIETPFFRQRFLVKKKRQIEKLRSSGVSHVYIDTEKGLDVEPGRTEEDAKAVADLLSAAAESKSAARALVLRQEQDEPGHYGPVELSREKLSRYARRKDELFQLNKQTLIGGKDTGFNIYFKRGVDIRPLSEVYDIEKGIGKDILDMRGDLLIEKQDIAMYKEYLQDAIMCGASDASSRLSRSSAIRENAKLVVKELMSDPRREENVTTCTKAVEELIQTLQDSGGLVTSLLTLNNFDYYTYTHSVDVCVLAVGVAMAMGMVRERDLVPLGLGCIMHDVGMSVVSSEILNKPSRHTAEEYNAVKRHVLKGYEIMNAHDGISVESIHPVLEHHERTDGSGYPYGLDGRSMHVSGKIASLVDTYDALTTRRVYQRAYTPFEALVMLRQYGDAFDRDVFIELVKLLGRNIEDSGEAPQSV